MGSLFKSPKAPPPPPPPPPPPDVAQPVTPLPDPGDVQLAARKRRAAGATRTGRQSTILSDSQTLG